LEVPKTRIPNGQVESVDRFAFYVNATLNNIATKMDILTYVTGKAETFHPIDRAQSPIHPLDDIQVKHWRVQFYLSKKDAQKISKLEIETNPLFLIAVVLILCFPFVWLLSIRGKICRKAFAEILFSKSNKQPLLINSLSNDNINHIICATELHAGEHIYFSSNFVYSYRCGFGSSESTTLAEVVQASAAFPPLLPPVKVNSFPFHFTGGQSDIPHKLILTDGGVYNNMGDQWIVGLQERKERSSDIKKVAFDADSIILVNSTATIKRTPMSWFNKIPLLGEGTIFYRIVCSLFDQTTTTTTTTTTRRKTLFTNFKNSLITGKGVRGIMVMLEQTPFQMLDWMKNTTEPELEKQRERTISVLDKLPKDYRKEWDTIKEISLKARTTFKVINQLTAENLLYHAFIVAMINAHIILGFPMKQELLDKDEFRKNILNKYCHER
jgi:predicted acylesterase/phospholipase RssA